MGKWTGKRLRGTDKSVDLPAPIRVAEGVGVVAESWRHGERHGPKAGSLVGVRYQLLAGPFSIDASRELAVVYGPEARLEKGQQKQKNKNIEADKPRLHLEPGEEAFLEALVDVLPAEGSQ